MRSRGLLGKALLTLFAAGALFLFLVPLLNMTLTSLKTTDQMSEPGAPIYPAQPATYEYEGKELPVYYVPIDGTTEELAMLKPGRRASEFINPKDPEAGPIKWEGNWRKLERPWQWAPTWSNYPEAWTRSISVASSSTR